MQLAQLNIARAKAPLDSPAMKEFMDNLEPVNNIAENSPGYVWRLQDDSGDATSIHVFDDPLIIVNMSVWESVEAFKGFHVQDPSPGISPAQGGMVRENGGKRVTYFGGSSRAPFPLSKRRKSACSTCANTVIRSMDSVFVISMRPRLLNYLPCRK